MFKNVTINGPWLGLTQSLLALTWDWGTKSIILEMQDYCQSQANV